MGPILKPTEGATVLFAFHLIDRPGAGTLRSELRPLHKAYLAQVAGASRSPAR